VTRPWVLVGPPASRRIAAFQRALEAYGLPAARVVDYADLLRSPQAHAPALLDGRPRVKLDSPGEAPALHETLIHHGWERLGGAAPQPLAHGELAWQHYWYAGFAALLQSLPPADYLNPPGSLLAMTDKLHCQQSLAAAQVAVPPLLGIVSGYEDLRARLRSAACRQAFIKARFGSSAAGVIAYRWHPDGREVAMASTERVVEAGRSRLFNSLRMRRYTDAREIAAIVDALAEQGAYAEAWVPKPSLPGNAAARYDLRVVVLDGRARQRVARVSKSPLTNLHLGNRRASPQDWLQGDEMAALEAAAQRAAAVFPGARMIGLDLILRGRRAWILEANGFGDLLLAQRWQGLTTYEDQVAWAQAVDQACDRTCEGARV